MKCTLSNVFIFAAGAAIGSAVTWKYVKTKYERIADEEIQSVKERYSKKQEKPVEEDKLDKLVEKQSNHEKFMTEYNEKINELRYSSDNEEGGSTLSVKPYVITPDDFGDPYHDYDTITLTFYADGVLADDYDEKIENVDEIVGIGSLQRFGEYEDDTVFVRNDALETDYEICRDLRRYSEVVGADD